ncbi:hypothetical protein [Nevskia sp.]|uniref:hypothetical protein n=1 Tax=Nevskia sp. TaxID=1929292 RepID=UPI003F7130D5
MMLRLISCGLGRSIMSKKTMQAMAFAVAVGTVAFLGQSRIAAATVKPQQAPEPALAAADATHPPKPVSRRARMARIVAEQAAISAEASARRTLARKASEKDTAMR